VKVVGPVGCLGNPPSIWFSPFMDGSWYSSVKNFNTKRSLIFSTMVKDILLAAMKSLEKYFSSSRNIMLFISLKSQKNPKIMKLELKGIHKTIKDRICPEK
jgi:hypothetical protein